MSDQKDTIYIDIDDEITSIIDKVVSSNKKIVALVLPKRASVLQSVVNMRLLKRASDEAGKSLVLITSEASVMPLAGAVGLYTAKTLQSKPFIPDSGVVAATTEDLTYPDNDDVDTSKPVGELAGSPEEEAIEVDNDDNEKSSTSSGATKVKDKKPKKDKKNKKFKIPNFDTFRKKLFLGLGIFILLAVGWYFAFYVMPKAKIVIKTDTTTTNVDVTFTADPAVKTVDQENKIVPAVVKESKKTSTQKVATTGEKNLGDKAKGSMIVTNCINDGESHTLPAGSAFSSGQFTFVTNEAVTLEPALFSGSNCKSDEFGLSETVGVTASTGGGSYNLSARTYTAAVSGITGSGSNMTGGTDKIVKVVSQQDVDTAKQKASEQNNTDGVKAEIQSDLTKEGYVPITETYASGEPVTTSTPAVGTEANEVVVNVVVTHSMLGAQKDGIKKLIEDQANKEIDPNKQMIIDDGMNGATYQVFDRQANGKTRLNVKSNVVAGPKLNADEIKKSVAGKRRGEAQEILKQPGVQDVEVIYSPFWVAKIPKDVNKITVVFEQSNGQ